MQTVKFIEYQMSIGVYYFTQEQTVNHKMNLCVCYDTINIPRNNAN